MGSSTYARYPTHAEGLVYKACSRLECVEISNAKKHSKYFEEIEWLIIVERLHRSADVNEE